MLNENTIQEIVEEYYDSIKKYCFYKLHNDNLAEDCTQEVFLILIKKKTVLINTDRIYSWLLKVADKVIKNQLRKNKKECSLDDVSEIEDRTHETSDVFDVLSDDEYKLLSDYYNSDSQGKIELAEQNGLTMNQLYKKIHAIKEKIRQQ